MRRLFTLLILAPALVLGWTGVARAAKTFVVFPITASAQYANDARVMTKLLRDEIDAIGGTKVYGTKNQTCSSIACARQVRAERDVDAVVVGELTTLGGELQLLIDVAWEDDVLSYHPQLEDTTEFRKIVGRLAEAIRKKNAFEDERGVDSVSAEDMYPYKNKIHGMWKYGLSLGMVAPMDNTTLGAGYLVGILPKFRYEIAQVAIEGETGVFYTDETDAGFTLTGIPLAISTHYYFRNADISPFVGATFGANLLFTDLHTERTGTNYEGEPTYSWAYDDAYWMFTVGAYAGLELLRTHTLNVNFRAGYQYGFVDFGDMLPAGVNDGSHGVFVQVGITFDIPTASYRTHHSDRYRYNRTRRHPRF